jgi:hypothetical protein
MGFLTQSSKIPQTPYHPNPRITPVDFPTTSLSSLLSPQNSILLIFVFDLRLLTDSRVTPIHPVSHPFIPSHTCGPGGLSFSLLLTRVSPWRLHISPHRHPPAPTTPMSLARREPPVSSPSSPAHLRPLHLVLLGLPALPCCPKCPAPTRGVSGRRRPDPTPCRPVPPAPKARSHS